MNKGAVFLKLRRDDLEAAHGAADLIPSPVFGSDVVIPCAERMQWGMNGAGFSKRSINGDVAITLADAL